MKAVVSRRLRLPRGEGAGAWLCAGSVALSLLALLALLALLTVRGLGHFWPSPLALVTLEDGRQLAGERVREVPLADDDGLERLYRTGNRDLDGERWAWVRVSAIAAVRHPADLVVVERRDGRAIGRLVALQGAGRERLEGRPPGRPWRRAWPSLVACATPGTACARR